MVFLGPELRDVQYRLVAVFLGFLGEGYGADDFVHGAGWEDDGDWVWFPPFAAGRTPKCADVGSGPRTVCHYDIDRAADTTVEVGEEVPVLFFHEPAEAFACAGVETLSGGVERAKHVGGDGRVVDVGASGNGGEEELGEGEGEGVAHCVNENVGDKKGESVVCEDKRADGLAQEGEVGVGGAQNVVAGCEREEDDGWWAESDIEAVLAEMSDHELSRGTKKMGIGTSTFASISSLLASSPV